MNRAAYATKVQPGRAPGSERLRRRGSAAMQSPQKGHGFVTPAHATPASFPPGGSYGTRFVTERPSTEQVVV